MYNPGEKVIISENIKDLTKFKDVFIPDIMRQMFNKVVTIKDRYTTIEGTVVYRICECYCYYPEELLNSYNINILKL